MIRRLRFLSRCALGKPLYAQLHQGGRAGEDALEELRRRHGEEAVMLRSKPFVFAIDRGTQETVNIERHQWQAEADARIKAINADATDVFAIGMTMETKTVRRMGPKTAYRMYRSLTEGRIRRQGAA